MTKSAEEKRYTKELSDVLLEIEDLKLKAKGIIEAADNAGINTKALKKVAKEMLKDSAKLAQQYEDELQLDMFRVSVGIRQRKGIEETVG